MAIDDMWPRVATL